ncbi:hypothetical protein SAMN05660652_01472 [Propionivibrio dicarboxylicus]|uniref:Uncharacterized protein n=1 Tax=Propionivibrio dicarboxylicus TaxID=83767 RepID=A0A1G8ARK2_9RHOO|nr:hypothetical protein SAMN05660652_01472 [Propionivibrio dicarboxylicus]
MSAKNCKLQFITCTAHLFCTAVHLGDGATAPHRTVCLCKTVRGAGENAVR